MLILLKLIIIALALLAVSKSYLDYKKGREPKVMFIFWIVVWVTAAVIGVYPGLIDTIAAYSKDSSVTIGSLIAVAFVFILFIVYRVYAKVARLEYQQAELIRKLGLKSGIKKDRK